MRRITKGRINGTDNAPNHLILGLRLFDLTEEEQELILLFLKTEEEQKEMVDYLLVHENASQQDILEQLEIILKTTQCDTGRGII